MPVEIKELHIKMAVNTQPGASSPVGQAADAGGNAGGGSDKDAIVSECVEQVLQVLHNRSER